MASRSPFAIRPISTSSGVDCISDSYLVVRGYLWVHERHASGLCPGADLSRLGGGKLGLSTALACATASCTLSASSALHRPSRQQVNSRTRPVERYICMPVFGRRRFNELRHLRSATLPITRRNPRCSKSDFDGF